MLKLRLAHDQRGATLVEFTLAATLVLLPLVLLSLQIALLGLTRRALDVAVVMTARAGAVEHGSAAAMRQELARAMRPLHVNAAMLDADDFRPAAAASATEIARGDYVTLRVVAPMVAAAAGETPNEGFDRRPGANAARNSELLQRNLLTIDLQYCAPMVVPIASSILAAVISRDVDDPFSARCLRELRLPMQVRNTQVMQSSFRGR